MTKAEKFVSHMVKRCQSDGRLAWLIDPLTESHNLMTDAYAEMKGVDPDEFREGYQQTLRPEQWPA